MNIQLKDVDNVVFNGIDISAVKFNNVLVWQKWETIEYTGAVPVTVTAAGEPLLDWNIKGNMAQSGTPTPESPITPSECGERTGNLWDEDYEGISQSLTYKPVYVGDGQYTLSSNIPFTGGTANIFFLAGNVSSGASTATNGVYDGQARTVNSVEGYVTIVYRNQTENPKLYNAMLNTGSTALPYSPYGYKLPFVSGDTTTPIYLGEVPTTRRIKKLVFDGTENWREAADTNIYITLSPNQGVAWTQVVSTHFTPSQIQTNGGLLWFANANVDFDTAEECKTYLAQQYANGTPVTVWYVLATEQTGILNEPIRKIGDYADTISMEQAQVQIPTVSGVNVVDIDTTLKPSSIYLKYKGKS